jgi:hypothetical protein
MNRSYLVRTEPIDSAAPQVWIYIGLVVGLVYVVNALLLGRVFAKAGRPVWRAWAPFANHWEFLKIGGLNGVHTLWLVGAIVAYCLTWLVGDVEMSYVLYSVAVGLLAVFLVAYVMAGLKIQVKLGKPLPFIILLFVNLVAPLWLWILALDRSKWSKKKSRTRK